VAQYKVLQDIEAEDKLLGPLSLRQFIYAVITVTLGFVAFRIFLTPAWFIGFIFIPPAIFFGLLAAPLGGQQSSEIWLLAKIRFFIKPRKRIWDQDGIQELVTITVPKKIEKQLTKGYSQDEVKSRLKALSSTLDTRGWAIKNMATNVYTSTGQASDRLLDIDLQDAPAAVVDPSADVLDPTTNPRAQNMDALIQKASEAHKDVVMKNIERAKITQAEEALKKEATDKQARFISEDEHALAQQLNASKHVDDIATSHLKTLQPLSTQAQSQKQIKQPVTPPPDPAIMNLVKNSEGLSVQTTAGLYNRMKEKGSQDDEVVISLH